MSKATYVRNWASRKKELKSSFLWNYHRNREQKKKKKKKKISTTSSTSQTSQTIIFSFFHYSIFSSKRHDDDISLECSWLTIRYQRCLNHYRMLSTTHTLARVQTICSEYRSRNRILLRKDQTHRLIWSNLYEHYVSIR